MTIIISSFFTIYDPNSFKKLPSNNFSVPTAPIPVLLFVNSRFRLQFRFENLKFFKSASVFGSMFFWNCRALLPRQLFNEPHREAISHPKVLCCRENRSHNFDKLTPDSDSSTAVRSARSAWMRSTVFSVSV